MRAHLVGVATRGGRRSRREASASAASFCPSTQRETRTRPSAELLDELLIAPHSPANLRVAEEPGVESRVAPWRMSKGVEGEGVHSSSNWRVGAAAGEVAAPHVVGRRRDGRGRQRGLGGGRPALPLPLLGERTTSPRRSSLVLETLSRTAPGTLPELCAPNWLRPPRGRLHARRGLVLHRGREVDRGWARPRVTR